MAQIDFEPSSNSHKSRELREHAHKAPVIKGNVVSTEKSLGKKITESLVKDDAKSIGDYLLFNVLIPAAKDTIFDFITKGVSMGLYGDARPSQRCGSVLGNRRDYSGISSRNTSTIINQTQPRNRSSAEVGDIVLDDFNDADAVLTAMTENIDNYDSVSVADLYQFTNKSNLIRSTDYEWGWTNLSTARITRVCNGYLIDLPRPKALKD